MTLKTNLTVIMALSLLAAAAVAATADGDIVYSARYYLAPGSHGTSHFHIYRINPDGSGRKQVTSGAQDDENPIWSPDGKRIAFIRGDDEICVIGESGGKVTKVVAPTNGVDYFDENEIHWMPDSRHIAVVKIGTEKNYVSQKLWVFDVDHPSVPAVLIGKASHAAVSPDHRHILLSGAGSKVADLGSKGSVSNHSHTLKSEQSGCWVSPTRIVSLAMNGPSLDVVDTTDWTTRSIDLKSSESLPSDNDVNVLVPIPGSTRRIIYGTYSGNSTTGPAYDLSFVDTTTGRMKTLLSGQQFIRFNPTGTRFLTAPCRALEDWPAPLQHKVYIRGKTTPQATKSTKRIWLAVLMIGKTSPGYATNLVGGLVWVTGADWR